MPAAYIIALLGTGVAVGFASGLLGVGGSFIMVPVQFWVFAGMEVPTDIAIRLAFGTNLLVVLSTSISGAWRHYWKGAVWWKAAIILGGCGLVGAYGGATAAAHIPGEVLKIIFGVVVLVGATRMVTTRLPQGAEEARDNPLLWVAWGLPFGILTGLIAVGGGALVIPVMILAFKFKMHQAVGTATAMMIFTSLGGLVGYVVNGLGVAGIPSPHIGYVHIWSWLALAVTRVGMAQVGAITAHKLPAKQLRYIFIAVMFYMGLKMLGLFDWLGWPI